jgi:hypothetical protein
MIEFNKNRDNDQHKYDKRVSLHYHYLLYLTFVKRRAITDMSTGQFKAIANFSPTSAAKNSITQHCLFSKQTYKNVAHIASRVTFGSSAKNSFKAHIVLLPKSEYIASISTTIEDVGLYFYIFSDK